MAKDVIIALDFPDRERTLGFLDRFGGERPWVNGGVDAVQAGIFQRGVGALGVHVAAGAVGAAQHQRADAEYAAAAAQVEHELFRRGVFFQRLQAHARGGVCPGAEGEAGVETQYPARALLRYRLPAGEDEQRFADLDGLVVFFPVVLPVGLVHHGGDGLQARALGKGGQLRAAGAVVADVDLHAREPAVALLELAVHIVPVLPVLLKETAEVRLVLDDQPPGPQLRQLVAERVEHPGRGAERRLYPAAHSSTGL